MSTLGKLYLIPATLGESSVSAVIPQDVIHTVKPLKHFVVENEKTARHYLKALQIDSPLNDLVLFALNEHTKNEEISNFLKPLLQGQDMGLLSEAGCPAVADPGAKLVELAHQLNIKVIPLVGPSSILLALMSSGFNGQNFAFNGYLPREKNEKIKQLKFFEKLIYSKNQTQIFIEAPYRNQQLLEDILKNCMDTTLLCIATDITLSTELIKTRPIVEWKKNIPQINKRPTIFLLYKYHSKADDDFIFKLD